MAKPKLKKTGRFAHVEMGEWDGENYELDGDFPVYQLCDGDYIVMLGPEELPPRCESEEMSAAKKNGGPR